jgi:TonB-linked SusC/RagA family outer membrane protein
MRHSEETMKKTLPDRQLFPSRLSHRIRTAGLVLLFALGSGRTASGQQIPIAGTVTSTAGAPLQGVVVRVQGTATRAVTSAAGRYTISAPTNGVLTFTALGKRSAQEAVAGRTRIDVVMSPVSYLEEVVVTAYTEQRRADITGAVASVPIETIDRQTSASVLQRLDAAVPGVTVAAGGSPGGRSTVRIRGISSFQNNDPLYIVDGVPVQDSYINFLNPDDITSMQVLKDASAASIYGSRASNGVILIETNKRGQTGAPRTTVRVRTGVSTPVRGYDDFLINNPLDYAAVLKASYTNAGLAVPTGVYGDPNNPSIPAYTYATPGAVITRDAFGRPLTVDASQYSYPLNLIMPGSSGTNWWKAVFGAAPVSDYNLSVGGGGDDNQYVMSFNYFNQKGTAAYNQFQRGNVRVNTNFTRSRLSFGENLAVSLARSYGGLPDDPGSYAEDGIIGKNILMQTVVPVYDIMGNFAGGKGNGQGNMSNPLKEAYEARNNINGNNQAFGNVFAGYELMPQLNVRSSLGYNLREGSFAGYGPPFPENAEATFGNSINENTSRTTDWTWTNTARYARTFRVSHSFDLLLGQEANGSTYRFLSGAMGSLLNTDLNSRFLQPALGDAKSMTVASTGSQSALLSYFGKIGYNFNDRYIASFTVRKDGSSRLGPTNRWGTFPAVGLGWRISNEPFFPRNRIFSDVMLRYGHGVTGNQSIPAGRIVSQFGGSRGDTYYDIAGSNSSIATGFRQSSLGNPDLKWEENRSTNVGTDLTMFDGMISVVFDAYSRKTSNLLYNPATPGTAGLASPPIVNVGSMSNKGFDFSIGHSGPAWTVNFNGSHYKNEILSIDGVQNFFYGPIATRFGNQVINQIGYPIGSFYGYIADGFFKDAADVTSHATQAGAAPGRIKFRDLNGDGKISLDDRTIIGGPDPKFTAGLDLGYRRGNWDVGATVFGTFGNDIFDVQKEFYEFRQFDSNVKADLLANSWTPTNLNAKYPRLDVTDVYSSAISSYYIEDGSYVRLRNVQVGYMIPPSLSRWVSATRVYVQAENLFTRTNYTGLDPSLPAANIFGTAGDIRDQYRGIDRGTYPSSRTISVGLSSTF